jgi:hypothetical protein
LSPCGLGDIRCGKAHKWISNGTELCRLAGFSVQVSEASSGAVDDVFCYGGKASLDSISDSWTSSKYRPTLSSVVSWDLQDFQRWATEMPVSERVSWAIGGMVLTAGLIFIRLIKLLQVKFLYACLEKYALYSGTDNVYATCRR